MKKIWDIEIVHGGEADIPLPEKQQRDRAVFDVIEHWARRAKALNVGDTPPDFKPLLDVLDKQPRRSFWHDGQITDFKKRTVIAFGTGKKTESNMRRRMMLPIHFATMSALNLVPNMSLKMVNKNAGQARPSNQQIHVINLTVDDEKARKLKTFETTSIFRILFNAPPDASIRERRGEHYRFIIPENFILAQRRSQQERDTVGQRSVLNAVRKLLGVTPKYVPARQPFSADEMVTLLTSLFRIGDEWYGNCLLDRCIGDPSFGRPEKMPGWAAST